MEMTTCHVCGKIYGSTGKPICRDCQKLLDIVYEKARAWLRDNPKEQPTSRQLAQAIGEDERLIDILKLEGRFTTETNDGPLESDEEKKRKRLLEDLTKSLSTPVQKQQGSTTYGSDRHGRG